MKTFNYIRVSTKEQNEDRQINAMQKFNADNKIKNAIELIDKATGTNTERANLQMLLKVVRKGDLVVIQSIDRLSRNYKECLALWQAITEKGADITVLDMPVLDTRQHKDLLGDFISNLIISVLGYVAQQETEFRKTRQTEGMNAMKEVNGKKVSKKTGNALGRPQAMKPSNWTDVIKRWENGEITAVQAMKDLQMTKTTFYKLIKE
jgi:DNA invertase Pin-like site-specific DNA recombinase